MSKSLLIDSNPEMATRRNPGNRDRERLSEETPRGDAIVRPHANKKHERLAEMTNPVRKMDSNKQTLSYGRVEQVHKYFETGVYHDFTPDSE